MTSLTSLIEYWIKALSISDLSGLRGSRLRLRIDNMAVVAGACSIESLPNADDFMAHAFPKNYRGDDIPVCFLLCVKNDAVRTLISDDTAAQRDEDENGFGDEKPAETRKLVSDTLVVYIVPAMLDRKGALASHPDGLPMIVRECLEPEIANSARHPVVGDYDTYVRAISSFGVGRSESSFSIFYDAALAMFAQVSHCHPDALLAMHRLSVLMVPANAGLATKSVAKVYRALRDNTTPPLLERLLTPTPSSKSSALIGDDNRVATTGHIAMVDRVRGDERQMFGLDPSQRRALHSVVSLGDNPGIVAVSGPPGTGKTDMLRAVISNLWATAAAASRKDDFSVAGNCPIVLVCGATRQSVKNVMGSMDGADRNGQEFPLKMRWIKGLGGYAAIVSAPSRLDEDGKEYQTVAEVWTNKTPEIRLDGLAADVGRLSNKDLPDLVAYYAQCFALAFPRAAERILIDDPRKTLNRASAFLRDKLKKSIDDISAGREALETGFANWELPQIEDWLGPAESSYREAGRAAFLSAWAERHYVKTAASKAEIVEMGLDVGRRSIVFHLAARFWETRWLCGLPKRNENGALIGRVDRMDQIRRISMLTPCMVSTLHSAPRLFMLYPRQIAWGGIDLAVVDEAGQAAPELGGALLALAKKALVVGDVKQLTPITQMTDVMEDTVAAACGADAQVLKAHFLASSSGSIMAMAMRASSRNDPGGRGGVRLRNHYRCLPGIIGYCLALMYNEVDDIGPELVAKTKGGMRGEWGHPRPDAYPLPPIGFVQGGSPLDDTQGKETKYNPGEARRLVDWLEEHGPKLLAWHRAGGPENAKLELKDIVKIGNSQAPALDR